MSHVFFPSHVFFFPRIQKSVKMDIPKQTLVVKEILFLGRDVSRIKTVFLVATPFDVFIALAASNAVPTFTVFPAGLPWKKNSVCMNPA
jgi:hypothetical protein